MNRNLVKVSEMVTHNAFIKDGFVPIFTQEEINQTESLDLSLKEMNIIKHSLQQSIANAKDEEEKRQLKFTYRTVKRTLDLFYVSKNINKVNA